MTEQEMQEAAWRLHQITSLKEKLGAATANLTWANANCAKDKKYQVCVTLKEREHYRSGVEAYIWLDAGVVQQSMLNTVNDLRRQIVALGGTVT